MRGVLCGVLNIGDLMIKVGDRVELKRDLTTQCRASFFSDDNLVLKAGQTGRVVLRSDTDLLAVKFDEGNLMTFWVDIFRLKKLIHL